MFHRKNKLLMINIFSILAVLIIGLTLFSYLQQMEKQPFYAFCQNEIEEEEKASDISEEDSVPLSTVEYREKYADGLAQVDASFLANPKCRLEVSIAKQWMENEANMIVGAQYDFVFYNDSAKDILNWTMLLRVPEGSRLDSYWSGECTYENDVITVQPLDYNQIIEVDADISFGFILMTPKNSTFHVEDCAIIFYRENKLWHHPLFWVLSIFLFALFIADLAYAVSGIRIKKYNLRQEADRRIIEQSLKTFANIIDAKDEYTRGHSQRVAYYSREIARRMNMSEETCRQLYYIALLHDIGKIGITDSILTKPGALTVEERENIKQHVVIGGEILKDFNSIPGIAEGAMYHHERYDGQGYSAGLSGDAIPLFARIICVADSFDAMSSARCYRGKLEMDHVVNELKTHAGTQFDKNIVRIMLEMIADGFAPVLNGEAEM